MKRYLRKPYIVGFLFLVGVSSALSVVFLNINSLGGSAIAIAIALITLLAALIGVVYWLRVVLKRINAFTGSTWKLVSGLEASKGQTIGVLNELRRELGEVKQQTLALGNRLPVATSPVADVNHGGEKKAGVADIVANHAAAKFQKVASKELRVIEVESESPNGSAPSTVEIQNWFELCNQPMLDHVEHRSFWVDDLNEDTLVPVPKHGSSFRVPCAAFDQLKISFEIAPGESAAPDVKSSFLAAFAEDEQGRKLENKLLQTEHPTYGSYRYLRTETDPKLFEVELVAPNDSEALQFTIMPWATSLLVSNQIHVEVRSASAGWGRTRPLEKIRVAVVLDAFSYESFRYEFDALPVTPENWREVFEIQHPELFLCESAWSGVDSEAREWKGQVYSSRNFRNENRNSLLAILDYCREKGIPTVFWNKEDPTHYLDKVHNFVDTAVKFDHVFTTDWECVERYRSDYGHKSVHCLPFAVQPRLFNPISRLERSHDLVFAGSWYENHEERSRTMASIFENALDSGLGLKIYDRFWGSEDKLHRFPEKFRPFTVPPVDYSQMSSVYKESIFGLTINTVTNSSTMFARRALELMACNTFVVSNYSQALDMMFGSNVAFIDKDPKALERLSSSELDEIRAQNLDLVLREHTYKQRFEQIVKVVGLEYKQPASRCVVAFRVHEYSEASVAYGNLLEVVGTKIVPTIIVASDVAPLDCARIFRNFNKNGVRVIDETLLISSRIRVSEAFSECSGIWLISSSQTMPSEEWLERCTLHSEYIDCPITEARTTSEKYRVARALINDGVFVKPTALRSTLQSISNCQALDTYSV